MTFDKIISLQFSYKDFEFEENFKKFSSLVKKTPENSIITAPELCISNFCYDDMKKATDFSRAIEKDIALLSSERLLALTMLEEENGTFYNRAKLFHNKKMIFQRDKYKLFKFGNEHKYFASGKKEDIKIIKTDGIKIAILICFELRFTELWEKTKGADIILIPALWGKNRKKHLEILANALSLANQCYVVVSNSSNSDMAKSSLVSDPFGELYKDDRKSILEHKFDKKIIKKMRKYLDVGIDYV